MIVVNSIKYLKKIIAEKNPSKVVLVSSEHLIKKLNWAIEELKEIAAFEIIEIPDGEKAKEWNVLEKLLKNFIDIGLDRSGIVLVMGGGSATDLVGFACSIYERGISFVNIPTTLMGQIDASIGGKTAINFLGYKNQIGSFYEPETVIIDIRFLKSLSNEQMIDGLTEIIKSGLIKDASIFEIIKSHNLHELKQPKILEELILKSIKVKKYFIAKDKKDKGLRQVLNFGHTIGHAIELKYNLSHGQAVLMGMLQELKLGEKLGKTEPKIRQELEKVLEKLGVAFDNKNFEIDWENVARDKKVSGHKINLPVIKKIGEAELIELNLAELVILDKQL